MRNLNRKIKKRKGGNIFKSNIFKEIADGFKKAANFTNKALDFVPIVNRVKDITGITKSLDKLSGNGRKLKKRKGRGISDIYNKIKEKKLISKGMDIYGVLSGKDRVKDPKFFSTVEFLDKWGYGKKRCLRKGGNRIVNSMNYYQPYAQYSAQNPTTYLNARIKNGGRRAYDGGMFNQFNTRTKRIGLPYEGGNITNAFANGIPNEIMNKIRLTKNKFI